MVFTLYRINEWSDISGGNMKANSNMIFKYICLAVKLYYYLCRYFYFIEFMGDRILQHAPHPVSRDLTTADVAAATRGRSME